MSIERTCEIITTIWDRTDDIRIMSTRGGGKLNALTDEEYNRLDAALEIINRLHTSVKNSRSNGEGGAKK